MSPFRYVVAADLVQTPVGRCTLLLTIHKQFVGDDIVSVMIAASFVAVSQIFFLIP